MNRQDMPIKDGQVFALNKLMRQFTKDRNCKLWVLARLAQRKALASSSDLTIGEWQRIRDMAYPDWPADDWTVGETFSKEVAGWINRYNEDVLGQMRMFE